VLLLDSIGELGSVYSLASVAFVGGSLVAAGGHNPLEAALFGVPVVMGSHYENFREPVELLRAADGLRVVERGDVAAAIAGLMHDPEASQAMGERAKKAIEAQAGATQRAAAAVVRLLTEGNA
jgi:3-deoxy-D-manno-octulosonic-acid transferase